MQATTRVVRARTLSQYVEKLRDRTNLHFLLNACVQDSRGNAPIS